MTDMTNFHPIHDRIGELSDRRCPECGRCLYVNKLGNAWCGAVSCRWKGNVLDARIQVPVPEQIRRDAARLAALAGYAAEGS